MSLKDIISPLYVWKRAFEKPYTSVNPLTERPGAERYRGFHQNDLEKCIGCGTCEAVCQNAAIDLVPVDGIATTKADSGLRPKIDYGRCCWCALCVDICPTGSLGMSNEYQWIETDPELFRFAPGVEKKPWDQQAAGYKRAGNYRLLDPERVAIPMLPYTETAHSFLELVKGYSKEQALKEADRCVECGVCVAACPAHMDIPEYIKAVREENLEEALRILYVTNPMSATCGRICTHRCEEVCSIGAKGDPVAIRWLKRYVIDQFNHEQIKDILRQTFEPNGLKVAVIGGGPAGLSAAYYLATTGYSVTVFEANPLAGGMLRYGIPEYRLPYDPLDKDIAHIVSLGVEIRTDTEVGPSISFDEIHKNYDAVYISVGLQNSYALAIAGEEQPGVIPGLQLLDDVTQGKNPEVGRDVIVIGGGNTAMDAARTARRLGAEVTILYRRREIDMPADREEIEEAKEEGVHFVIQAIPVQINRDEDGRLALTWAKAEMVDQGPGKRPKPVLIVGETDTSIADTIVSAVGQSPEYTFLSEEIGNRLNFRKTSVVTDQFGQTSVPGIFAGGDIVNTTADAISAIADGHRAAQGIDFYLSNKAQELS